MSKVLAFLGCEICWVGDDIKLSSTQKYLKNGSRKLHVHQHVFKRVFSKFSNDTQVDRLEFAFVVLHLLIFKM